MTENNFEKINARRLLIEIDKALNEAMDEFLFEEDPLAFEKGIQFSREYLKSLELRDIVKNITEIFDDKGVLTKFEFDINIANTVHCYIGVKNESN